MKIINYFIGSLGHKLSLRIDQPNQESQAQAYILYAHYFTGNKDNIFISRLTKKLLSLNIGVIRFDHTGLGNSDGEFSDSNFSSNVDDIIYACNFINEKYDIKPTMLLGHSFGGLASICAANKLSYIKIVGTIGSPSTPTHVTKHFINHIDKINTEGSSKITIANQDFIIKKQFLDDVNNYDIDKEIKSYKNSLLIMHSPTDEIVKINNAQELYQKANHPKSFISLNKADHLLLKSPKNTNFIANIIYCWVNR